MPSSGVHGAHEPPAIAAPRHAAFKVKRLPPIPARASTFPLGKHRPPATKHVVAAGFPRGHASCAVQPARLGRFSEPLGRHFGVVAGSRGPHPLASIGVGSRHVLAPVPQDPNRFRFRGRRASPNPGGSRARCGEVPQGHLRFPNRPFGRAASPRGKVTVPRHPV